MELQGGFLVREFCAILWTIKVRPILLFRLTSHDSGVSSLFHARFLYFNFRRAIRVLAFALSASPTPKHANRAWAEFWRVSLSADYAGGRPWIFNVTAY
jgi:hypothetical protein